MMFPPTLPPRRFVEHEQLQRATLEEELRCQLDNLASLKISTISHIEILRSEMHCEMAQLHEAIMVREEELQANKLARRRAIEAAVSASWRRVDRAAVQAAFHSWRWVWVGYCLGLSRGMDCMGMDEVWNGWAWTGAPGGRETWTGVWERRKYVGQ